MKICPKCSIEELERKHYMNARAILKHNFRRGFVLNQENIIKLRDIITQRLNPKKLDYNFVSKIYREDSLLYTTLDIDDIFKEENSKRNKITEIEFSIINDQFELHLTFDKDDGCYLKIESEDKDLAYLTFSDTKDYLNAEVLKQSSINISSIVNDRLFSLFAMLISMICGLVLIMISKEQPSHEIIQQLLESTNVNDKMNFILNNQIKNSPTNALISLSLGMGSSFFIFFASYFTIKKLFPRNIFYFGKEIIKYDKINDLKSKFSWVIIIGFVISIISGLIVNFISK